VKLAFFSPLPPARTGVADYSAGLLGELRRHARVDVLEAPRSGYDNSIYQLGNNPLHQAVYRAAVAAPGIAVLHDALLHHLLLGMFHVEHYVEEFVHNYGQWTRDLARELWRGRSRATSDARYFQYPMLRRVAEASRAVVVHNPAARRRVLEAAPGARVVEIPHYFERPALSGDGRATRDRLGIATNEIVVSTFGYLRESKRIPSVLKAMEGLPRARFLLVGEFVSAEFEQALEPQLEASGAVRLGRVPEEEFWRLAEITDICVNLRSPSAGETSGVGIRMMGLGKPVVVTRGEEVAAFPELSVIRIDPGQAEVEMLAHYLRALAASAEMRREIGARAAAYIAERHSLEDAARMYLELAEETAQRPLRVSIRGG